MGAHCIPTSTPFAAPKHAIFLGPRQSPSTRTEAFSPLTLTRLQVTGVSGYAGAHVASRLLHEGYRVRG